MIKTKDKRITKIYAIAIIGLVALALILGATIFNKPADAQVTGDSAVNLSLSEKALDKILGALGLSEPAPSIGAVVGPDRFNPCESRNGIIECFTTVALKTATTSVCSITSPAATSTLIYGGIKFTTSSSTASLVTIAKGAINDNNATTTLIGSQNVVGANAQDTIIATTTAAQDAAEALLFSPSVPLNISMQGSGEGTYSPVGVCQAIFRQI